MLYHLSHIFQDWNLPGSGMFTYVSFRALLALMISLILSLWLSKKFITYMKRKRHIEKARDEEIDPYGVKKKGVPSMGGVVIIFAILVPVLLLGKLSNVYIILLLVTLLWFGLLGFYDDWKKLKGNKDGLKPRYKLMAQFTLGALVGVVLYMSPQAVLHENVTKDTSGAKVVYKTEKPVKSTITTVPFFKNNNLDYLNAFSWISDGKTKRACGWILFIIITTFVITAVSNGANLNDGMDGMCAGNSAIIGVALLIFAYVSSHIIYASYFDIMYIPHTQELVVFLSAFVGAMIGFLWYNAYPAQVFMGDTGSLTIGGIIGVCAIIVHKELLLPILCGIFFIESLSVILQTQWFKIQKRKGKRVRIFRATPIHDTFRKLDSQLDATSTYVLKGWPHRPFHESKITIRFWITTIILVAITIITLKIR